MESENWTFGNDDPKPASTTDRIIHPEGVVPLRLADAVKAKPGVNQKTGIPFARVTLIWLSTKKDPDGNPLWLFTTCPKNTYGGKKNGQSVGKPSRLRIILEALVGHTLGDDETENLVPSYVIGKYVLGKVTHWERNGATGAQVDQVMPLPEGMEVTIDLSSYVRPPSFGGSE